MMQEVEVLKTIPELVCSYFSEEQFTLSSETSLCAKIMRSYYNNTICRQKERIQGHCHNIVRNRYYFDCEE